MKLNTFVLGVTTIYIYISEHYWALPGPHNTDDMARVLAWARYPQNMFGPD